MRLHGLIPRTTHSCAAIFVYLLIGVDGAAGQDTTTPVQPAAVPRAENASDPLLPYSVLRGEAVPSASPVEAEPSTGEPIPATGSTVLAADDIRSASFRDIEPGVTTSGELRAAWGEPIRQSTSDGQELLSYASPPFQQVDVQIDNGVVTSIVVHLREPASPVHVAQQIDVSGFHPVAIPDRYGKVLGQAYPERGVAFNFAVDPSRLLVSEIFIEPVSAETFVLRAEYDFNNRFQNNLRDLEIALRLDPQHAHAHWLSAQLLVASGNESAAMPHAAEAVRLQPGISQYRLTWAVLLGHANKRIQAAAEMRTVLDLDDLEAEVLALTHNHLGELLEDGSPAERAESLQHHLAAIRIALPLAGSPQFRVRRLAKKLLIDSHLRAAIAVSEGSFGNKEVAVAQWLQRAEVLIDDYVADKGDPSWWLRFYEAALVASDSIDAASITRIVTEANREGQRLADGAPDALYRRSVYQAWGRVMLAAVHAEDTRQRTGEALRYAQQAHEHLTLAMAGVEPSAFQSERLADLCFTTGALLAIDQQNPSGALTWYEMATDHLAACEDTESLSTKHRFGGWYVTMGVTYWKTDRQERALELTQQGIEFIQDAVAGGAVAETALVVPCENISAMYRSLGQPENAQHFEQLATRPQTRLEAPSEPILRR